ncbi:type I restriction-modification system subunit M [Acetobacterium woodii]|uniref:site-specific DNA-methyltransferase (adenine-specific) n=1 Tax=Acetobacterium woodii (strain ATCC 29683 / DSM 1030 / JCM 2381 / KCTC 1655 / WB1) TaxID=931626 RepID=H6LHR4_ACEWD|nr:type I restriction-modification system subunit M [Acetobacterium woodii]AFA47243.1 type I restriction-modification system methyltransferase subunit HsdM1 [Acetobacterium woodii DSM 1030]
MENITSEKTIIKLDLPTLEKKLWDCADVLRGTLNSTQYMEYIFGMLFLKRINDQFDAEHADKQIKFKNLPLDALEQVVEDPKAYQNFFIPKQARWAKFKDMNLNIGAELDKAFKAIEDEPRNVELVGVLTTANYNDKERVPDGKLNQLIQIFDSMNLSNEGLVSPDILGDAYMYLIKKFADDGGQKGGEFYTPTQIKDVMVRLIKPHENLTIYDPCAGSGGFLVSAIEYVKAQGQNHRNLQLFGQEINLTTWAIAKLNMLLHDVSGATIWKGDTIRHPQNTDGSVLRTFDMVLSNPPFSLKNWGREVAQKNDYGRFNYGVAPASYGDLAFVQHMLASLNTKGIMATVVPHGILFRGGEEGKIRQGLLEDDLFEAVIGFPQNLFYGASIPAAVIILNKNKPTDRKGKVLFIEASRGFVKDGNKNKLTPENIDHIVGAYDAFGDEDKFASLATLDQIRKNDYNLNITRYVDTSVEEEVIDMDAVIARLSQCETELATSKETINGFLKQLGFEQI